MDWRVPPTATSATGFPFFAVRNSTQQPPQFLLDEHRETLAGRFQQNTPEIEVGLLPGLLIQQRKGQRHRSLVVVGSS